LAFVDELCLQSRDSSLRAATISSDRKTLFILDDNQTVLLIDVPTMTLRDRLSAPPATLATVVIAPKPKPNHALSLRVVNDNNAILIHNGLFQTSVWQSNDENNDYKVFSNDASGSIVDDGDNVVACVFSNDTKIVLIIKNNSFQVCFFFLYIFDLFCNNIQCSCSLPILKRNYFHKNQTTKLEIRNGLMEFSPLKIQLFYGIK
jgi:hypothetical protein